MSTPIQHNQTDIDRYLELYEQAKTDQRRKLAREYYRKNRERVRASNESWKANNRDTYLRSMKKYNDKRRKKSMPCATVSM